MENNNVKEAGLKWGDFSLRLDYEYQPAIRNLLNTKGGISFFKKLESNRTKYNSLIQNLNSLKNLFRQIPLLEKDEINPFWDQNWFPCFDGAALYGLLATYKPERYIEIGSGNSTKFARRAIVDNNLTTKIISIDPYPRENIDVLCDEVIRKKIEDIPHEYIMSLIRPEDILFIDNSHRSFQGSDVTICLTEIIPSLPKGVIYGLHDIFLPFDYPHWFKPHFYNEQYLLYCYLAGGGNNDEILFPTWYISTMKEIASPLYDIFDTPVLAKIDKGGSGFWLTKG